jgi:zinc protease
MAQAPSEQSARARVDQLIGHGAQFNTVTTSDEVMFVDVLPAGALEFGLWLESERLRRGQATDESLQLQRKTARDRDQLALSLSQLGLGRSRLEQLTFEGYWPYEHDPFGAASIAQATLPLLQAFLHDYYVPNNAVLAITGHFNPEEATRAIHRYFDDIPRHPQLPIANPAPLPEQTNQRSATVRSEQTHSSILLLGWAVPAARQPEHDALGMAASILGEGADSRFAQRIARAKLAVSFSVEIDERRGPSLLLVAAQGPSETNLLAARKLIEEEIDALARLGPSTDEMRRLWRQAQTAFLLGLASSDQRAMRLASLELLHGDARLVHAELSRVLSIGKDDIRKAVARLLTPTRRSLVAANQEGRPVDAAATPIPAPHGAVVPASHGPVSAAPTAKPAGKKKPGPAKPDKPASKKKKK